MCSKELSKNTWDNKYVEKIDREVLAWVPRSEVGFDLHFSSSFIRQE